jgi:thiol:disulfide interchange protein DsbG
LKHQHLFLACTLFMALTLGGCSPQEAGNVATPAKREVSVQTVSQQAKGFSVGALMSANTVYVFFDSQCPHCGHLWEAAAPLQKQVKFVWIPIGMINATSAAQGAALLTSANPAALMSEHEASLLAGKGGISASSSVTSEIAQAIKSNTQLLNSFGAESVPFVVAKNLKTGQTVSHEGAFSTQALAEFLGVEAP